MRVAAINQGLPTAKAPPVRLWLSPEDAANSGCSSGQAPASGSLQPTVYRTAPALAADRLQELDSRETKRTWNKREYKGNRQKTSMSGQKRWKQKENRSQTHTRGKPK